MKCIWCNYDSDSLEAFELDYINNKGVWCPECDGFTYFNENEVFNSYNLLLEKKDYEVKVHSAIKFNKQLSPLRYPGGKSKLIDLLYPYVDKEKKCFVEPYCGGCSVSLALLAAGVISQVVLNDLDYGIFSLFNLILYDTKWLEQAIREFIPTREEFFKGRSIILDNYKNVTERQAGFAMLTVNRIAYSGVIRANPKSNIMERWNANTLIRRINWISEQKDKIKLLNLDAESIIQEYYWNKDNVIFIDPPYYSKGKVLYNLYYKEQQHESLALLLNTLYSSYPGCADILITYDNEPFIKNLYPYSNVQEIGRVFSIAN